MSKTKVLRFEPYPLLHAAKASENREANRAKRLGHDRHDWYRNGVARYRTVQLARVSKNGKLGWMLAYEGKPNTGLFDTRQKAVAWFAESGR